MFPEVGHALRRSLYLKIYPAGGCEYVALSGGDAEAFQALPVVGEGFGDTSGVFDDDPRNFQADQREAHGDPMVVIRLDGGGSEAGSRVDGEAIGALFDHDAQTRQLRTDGGDPVALLPARMGDIADC